MAYLRRTAAVRKNLREKFPWARSVVCLAAAYPGDRPACGIGAHIARYAQGDDYHDVLDKPLCEVESLILNLSREKLGIEARTRRYIDTGPIMEKLYAARAGIGWFGKNTLVLNETGGSYFFLAEIVTDLDLPPDPPAAERCGTCTRCLDACPTKAFTAPYVLDATRCISYQTIESKIDIPKEIADHLDGNLFGCDICQEVCPWNSPAGRRGQADRETQVNPAFRSRESYQTLTLKDVAEMSPDTFAATFRKSPLKRPGVLKLQKVSRMISTLGAFFLADIISCKSTMIWLYCQVCTIRAP